MIRWPFKKSQPEDPIEEKDKAFEAIDLSRREAAKRLDEMNSRLRALLEETVDKVSGDDR